MNQTFLCHNGSVTIIINDTSRILDVEIEGGIPPFSIERDDIIADTAHNIRNYPNLPDVEAIKKAA